MTSARNCSGARKGRWMAAAALLAMAAGTGSLLTGTSAEVYAANGLQGTVSFLGGSGTITSGDIFDVDIDLPSLKLYVSQNNVKKVGDVHAYR